MRIRTSRPRAPLQRFGQAAVLLASSVVATSNGHAQEPGPQPAPAEAIAPAPRIVAVTAAAAQPAPSPAQDAIAPDAALRENGASDVLEVFLDHAKVIRLPERTQTVIVGNPFIADVTVQRNGILVVTGKSYGATNLIALDPQGLLLAESMISVQAPTESVVVVQRGLARESYSCTPTCQPSLRLGDAPEYFGAVGTQATQRSGFATE